MTSRAEDYLLFGANGQLGSELGRRLAGRAVLLARSDCDLCDRQAVVAAVETHRPTVVINAAGYTAVDQAQTDAATCDALNAGAVGVLAEACDAIDATLVTISTDYVFDGDAKRDRPWSENEPTSAVGVYARSKAKGEEIALGYRKSLVIRTCGLYAAPSAERTHHNFAGTILRLAAERPRLSVVADQRCTPSYVPHVAAAILELVELGRLGVFHVVNDGATTWHGFAVELLKQAGVSTPVEAIGSDAYPSPVRRPAYSVLDTTKLSVAIGRRLPSWEAGIADYLCARGESPRSVAASA